MTMTEYVGTLLLGTCFSNYKAVSIIAENESVCIFKGQDIDVPNNYVAIKILQNGSPFEDPVVVLKREANILKELAVHPHIVRCLEFQSADSRPYLILDYVDGEPVLKRLPPGYRLKLDQIVKYVPQITDALQRAHDKKICHGDIRPENILITRDQRVVICDFGMALKDAIKYQDERKNFPINEQYFPPERRRDKCIKPVGEQYSLALIVFRCLCGELPSGVDTIKQQVINARYSPEIGKVLGTALAEDATQRYGSVTQFSEALVQAINAEIAIHPQRNSSSQPATASTPQTNVNHTPPLDTVTGPPSTSSQLSVATGQENPRLATVRRRSFLKGIVSLPAAIALPLTWIKLWSEVSTQGNGSSVFGSTIRVYLGHSKAVNAVAWSPDSQWIASASADGTVQLWKPRSENERIIYPSPYGPVSDIAWSHYHNYDNLIAFCSEKSVYVWDFFNNAPPNRIYTASSSIRSLAWTPDLPAQLAIAGDRGIIQVLQIEGSSSTGISSQSSPPYTAPTIKSNTTLSDVAWSYDSMYLAACSPSTFPYVWVWDAGDGGLQHLAASPGKVNSIAWAPAPSPASQYQLAMGRASEDSTVQVWNVPGNGNQHQPIDYTYSGDSTGIDTIVWSPSQRYIVAGAEGDGYVYMWNTGTSAYKQFAAHRQSSSDFQQFSNKNITILALAWSPDGTMIASGGTDSVVRVWASGIGTF